MNWRRYVDFFRLDFLGFTDEEYEAFYHLRFADRLRATLAFLLFIGVMVVAMIPVVLTVVAPTTSAQLTASLIVALSFYLSGFPAWFILFPKLRRFVKGLSWFLGSSALVSAMYLAWLLMSREIATSTTGSRELPFVGETPVEVLETVTAWAFVSGPLVLLAISVGLRWLVRITRRMHNNTARRALDLELAGQIQDRLIPPLELHRGRLSVYGRSRLALEVGGDGFDVIELPTDAADEWRLVTTVSDVSGHGTGAGLLMALLKGALQAEVHHRTQLHNLAATLNRIFHAHSTKQMYATLCAVRLHISAAGTHAEVVDAGHLPLLHYSQQSKTVERVKAGGLGLGLTSKASYKTHELDLAPGDALLLLTDGLVETRRRGDQGPTGPEFGLSRVQSHFRDAARAGASTLEGFDPERYVESLFDLVTTFQGDDEPPEDDQTAVCVVVGASS